MGDPEKGQKTPIRIAVLVLSADGPYTSWINGIRQTWGKETDENFRVFYYYGHREGFPVPPKNKCIQIGDDLICGCTESFHNVMHKTAISFVHVFKNVQFDYLFRCCATSYVQKDRMVEFLRDKPRNRFFCGVPIRNFRCTYVAGWGYFMSRDLVETVVSNTKKLTYGRTPDDLALTRFLSSVGVENHPGAKVETFPSGKDRSAYHYHLKATLNPDKMLEAHSILSGENKASEVH